MKSIIYILLLVSFVSSDLEAQRKKSRKDKEKDKTEAYVNKIFGKSDKDFDIMKAPEKWADEPAVILCQKNYFYYDNPNQIATTQIFNELKGTTRKRILIQDKSALEDYSEYYYQDGGTLGLTVIKPDGTTNELDLSNAVEVKKDVPSYYRSKYRSAGYFKVAVPNLEIGDIIDYYVVYVDMIPSVVSEISTISEEYPVVKQSYIFDLPKKWTFTHQSFNGAPEIKKDRNTGLNKKGKKKDSVTRYVLEDGDREAASADRWDMPYLTEPTIKLLIQFNGYAGGMKISDDLSTVQGMLDFYEGMYRNVSGVIAKGNRMHWDSKILKDKSEKEAIYTMYNMLKYRYLKDAMALDNQERAKMGDVFPYSEDYNQMDDGYFIEGFSRLLASSKIEFQKAVLIPKEYGFAEDALTPQEYRFGIYVPSLDEYFFAPDNYGMPGEKRAELAGATGYLFPSKKDRKKDKKRLKDIEFPESKYSENLIDSKLEVSIVDSKNISVVKNIDYTGVYKKSNGPLLLYNTTFAYDDIYKLSKKASKKKMDAFNDKKSFKKNDWRAERYKKKRAKQEEKFKEYKENKFEYVQNWVKDQYDIEEIKEFEIEDFGQKVDAPLAVKYSFETEEYIKKAGPNLIFDIGKLITGQVELTEEEISERKKPIELNFARTITNEIVVTIPEGKSVEGLEALNMNIDNESGAFISSAVLSGNTLTVKTNKVYKQEFLPLEKWSELVEMLEAAYKFSQLKVVIK